MKSAFAITGLILAGILMMALILNKSPDLFEQDDTDYSRYITTTAPVLHFKLVAETEATNVWDQIREINSKNNSTAEEAESDEDSENEEPPVTMIPDDPSAPPELTDTLPVTKKDKAQIIADMMSGEGE